MSNALGMFAFPFKLCHVVDTLEPEGRLKLLTTISI